MKNGKIVNYNLEDDEFNVKKGIVYEFYELSIELIHEIINKLKPSEYLLICLNDYYVLIIDIEKVKDYRSKFFSINATSKINDIIHQVLV